MGNVRIIPLFILDELYKWFISIYSPEEVNKGAEFEYKDVVVRIFWKEQTK